MAINLRDIKSIDFSKGSANQIALVRVADSLRVRINGTDELTVDAAGLTFDTLTVNTNIVPDADDGAGLGVSGTAFSDLFLASGAVINFNAGDVTLTHSSNTLTLAGGIAVLPTASTIGTLTLADGSITDSSGSISFGNENLSTTGSLSAGTSLTPGTGTAGATLRDSGIITIGSIIYTWMVWDIAGIVSKDTANDVIGDDDTANAHWGQITAAVNGTIVGGKVTCLETPAGGDDDIDFNTSSDGTVAEDVDITGATGYSQLINSGDWTAGTVQIMANLPAANSYIYLSAGTGDTAATYTAGKFLVELYGT